MTGVPIGGNSKEVIRHWAAVLRCQGVPARIAGIWKQLTSRWSSTEVEASAEPPGVSLGLQVSKEVVRLRKGVGREVIHRSRWSSAQDAKGHQGSVGF